MSLGGKIEGPFCLKVTGKLISCVSLLVVVETFVVFLNKFAPLCSLRCLVGLGTHLFVKVPRQRV